LGDPTLRFRGGLLHNLYIPDGFGRSGLLASWRFGHDGRVSGSGPRFEEIVLTTRPGIFVIVVVGSMLQIWMVEVERLEQPLGSERKSLTTNRNGRRLKRDDGASVDGDGTSPGITVFPPTNVPDGPRLMVTPATTVACCRGGSIA